MRKVGGTLIQFPLTEETSARLARNLQRDQRKRLAQQMLASPGPDAAPAPARIAEPGTIDFDALTDRLLDEFNSQNGF